VIENLDVARAHVHFAVARGPHQAARVIELHQEMIEAVRGEPTSIAPELLIAEAGAADQHLTEMIGADRGGEAGRQSPVGRLDVENYPDALTPRLEAIGRISLISREGTEGYLRLL